MKAPDTVSCAPAKHPTQANPIAKPAPKPGRAGNRSSRSNTRWGLPLVAKQRMRIRTYGSRGHIGMGVSELETGILSGEAGVREIPEPLRQPLEHGGSELHVSPLPDREIASRLDRGDSDEFSIRH